MGYTPPMPLPGKRWYHVTFCTYNSWLPGDQRGFRSRHHKLHSTGDHRNPPPKGEHAGLHHDAKQRSGPPAILPASLRPIVGHAVLRSMRKHGHEVLVIAVGGQHVHLLVQLPIDLQAAEDAIGIAKKTASQAIRKTLPGRVWAKGCNPKPIRDEAHHRETFGYILRHREEGAWVWSFREGDITASG